MSDEHEAFEKDGILVTGQSESQFYVLNHEGIYQKLTELDVIEAAKRLLQNSFQRGFHVKDSLSVKDYLQVQLAHLEHEVFYVLWLDNHNRLIAEQELFRGTIDTSVVFPREVVKVALKHNAAKVVLAHNHPSGVAEPSEFDLLMTKHLVDALYLIGVKVLDHIIVGEHTVSLKQRGFL